MDMIGQVIGLLVFFTFTILTEKSKLVVYSKINENLPLISLIVVILWYYVSRAKGIRKKEININSFVVMIFLLFSNFVNESRFYYLFYFVQFLIIFSIFRNPSMAFGGRRSSILISVLSIYIFGSFLFLSGVFTTLNGYETLIMSVFFAFYPGLFCLESESNEEITHNRLNVSIQQNINRIFVIFHYKEFLQLANNSNTNVLRQLALGLGFFILVYSWISNKKAGFDIIRMIFNTCFLILISLFNFKSPEILWCIWLVFYYTDTHSLLSDNNKRNYFKSYRFWVFSYLFLSNVIVLEFSTSKDKWFVFGLIMLIASNLIIGSKEIWNTKKSIFLKEAYKMNDPQHNIDWSFVLIGSLLPLYLFYSKSFIEVLFG